MREMRTKIQQLVSFSATIYIPNQYTSFSPTSSVTLLYMPSIHFPAAMPPFPLCSLTEIHPTILQPPQVCIHHPTVPANLPQISHNPPR